MPAYHRPASIEQALSVLAGSRCVVLAGGTDYYPARVGRPLDDDVVDLTAIDELRGVRDHGTHLRIGATTTWSDIGRGDVLPEWAQALVLAAREIGGEQVQNAGTVAGNLCNASPAADGVPPLLALDASVELSSSRATRTLPLARFIVGPRRTALAPDEMVTAVIVPKPGERCASSTFVKLGSRRYLVISFACVAASIEAGDDGLVARARIAVGACSPVAVRLPALEQALAGARAAPGIAHLAADRHLAPLAPICDVRADRTYRREAALVLVRRALARTGASLATALAA